jgi:hypothetical protein
MINVLQKIATNHNLNLSYICDSNFILNPYFKEQMLLEDLLSILADNSLSAWEVDNDNNLFWYDIFSILQNPTIAKTFQLSKQISFNQQDKAFFSDFRTTFKARVPKDNTSIIENEEVLIANTKHSGIAFSKPSKEIFQLSLNREECIYNLQRHVSFYNNYNYYHLSLPVANKKKFIQENFNNRFKAVKIKRVNNNYIMFIDSLIELNIEKNIITYGGYGYVSNN